MQQADLRRTCEKELVLNTKTSGRRARRSRSVAVKAKQGGQFTADEFTAVFSRRCRLSVDRKDAACDNVFLEWLSRPIKYEQVNVKECEAVSGSCSDLAPTSISATASACIGASMCVRPSRPARLCCSHWPWLHRMKIAVCSNSPPRRSNRRTAPTAGVDNSAPFHPVPGLFVARGKTVQRSCAVFGGCLQDRLN